MKPTIEKAIRIRELLTKLSFIDEAKQINITGNTRYDIGRNLRKTKEALADYDKMRNDLFTKYGTPVIDKDTKRTTYKLTPGDPNYDLVAKQMDDVIKRHVVIDIRVFTESSFKDTKDISSRMQEELMELGLLVDDPISPSPVVAMDSIEPAKPANGKKLTELPHKAAKRT